MTQPTESLYQTFSGPGAPSIAVAPVGSPPSDLVTTEQLRTDAAEFRAAAKRGAVIVAVAVIAAVGVTVLSAAVSSSTGGYRFFLFGPIVYAFYRGREARSSRRKAEFYEATASLWDAQRPDLIGRPAVSRSTVMVEFGRHEASTVERENRPFPKWIWVALVAMFFALIVIKSGW